MLTWHGMQLTHARILLTLIQHVLTHHMQKVANLSTRFSSPTGGLAKRVCTATEVLRRAVYVYNT